MPISPQSVVQPTSDEGVEANHTHRPARQTTAWAVLSIAFGIFVVLVIGAAVAAKHYYDVATEPRTARLSIEEGIVLFRDAVSSTLINGQNDLELREGDGLLVGQGARASILLDDGSRVYLYSGAEVNLNELRKSRFHQGFSGFALGMDKGTARLEVASSSAADSQFTVATPFGYAVLDKGNYGVDVSEGRTRISARSGKATAYSKSGTAELESGEKVLLTESELSGPLPEGDQLVQNGDFVQGFSKWEMLQVDEQGRPVETSERMLATEEVEGANAIAMRVSRYSPLATHNETGLSQNVNRDVQDYESLQLHAAVKVDDQSLSGGGYMGYEYPVMIRVKYRDATGGQIDWSHGFFFRNPENRPTPNGQMVSQGEWFSYSGELMQIKPKPVHIISVEVLGAGHSFTGMVANVSLSGK